MGEIRYLDSLDNQIAEKFEKLGSMNCTMIMNYDALIEFRDLLAREDRNYIVKSTPDGNIESIKYRNVNFMALIDYC